MKVAFFHELNEGGARRVVNEFAKEVKKNHTVDLYVIDAQIKLRDNNYFSNIFFYSFLAKQWEGDNWKVRLYKDTIELYKLYKLHKRVAEVINKKKYDIVFVNPSKWTQAPFILRFLRGKKIYYGQEPLRLVYDSLLILKKDLGIVRYSYEKINRWIRKIIDRQNISHAKLCVAPSLYRKRLFFDAYHKNFKVIYCGVDTKYFRPVHKKRDIDLLYIGSKAYLDGYDTFIASVARMKNNPKKRILLTDEEWISDDADLRDLYRRSKVLVCTARKEGLGLATLEAMACGVVVVAVNEAGHKETVVDGKTGYLLPRSPEKIADKLDWLLTHSNMVKVLGKKSREVAVRKWSWKICAKELEDLIVNYIKN